MDKITLGYAQTRRSIFSTPAALKYRNLTKRRLEEQGSGIVDIDDINGEGLLYDDKDLLGIATKFRVADVGKVQFEDNLFTINSVRNATGDVIVKLGSVSNMVHTINKDVIPYVWDFFKKFSRRADGTLVITQ
jgi:hypothetical protein